MRAAVIVILAAVLLGTARGSDDATRKGPPPTGAFECPCLSSTDSRYTAVKHQLAVAGYPGGHGMEGCRAYDEGSQLEGCHVAFPPEFCSKPWCYVDMELCPIDVEKCKQQGGLIGSETSPFCRQRDHAESNFQNILQKSTAATAATQNMTISLPELYYSYATCGSVDMYGPKLLEKSVGNRNVRISLSPGTCAGLIRVCVLAQTAQSNPNGALTHSKLARRIRALDGERRC